VVWGSATIQRGDPHPNNVYIETRSKYQLCSRQHDTVAFHKARTGMGASDVCCGYTHIFISLPSKTRKVFLFFRIVST